MWQKCRLVTSFASVRAGSHSVPPARSTTARASAATHPSPFVSVEGPSPACNGCLRLPTARRSSSRRLTRCRPGSINRYIGRGGVHGFLGGAILCSLGSVLRCAGQLALWLRRRPAPPLALFTGIGGAAVRWPPTASGHGWTEVRNGPTTASQNLAMDTQRAQHETCLARACAQRSCVQLSSVSRSCCIALARLPEHASSQLTRPLGMNAKIYSQHASIMSQARKTVKLVSAESFEFFVDYRAACVSNTIKQMLSSTGAPVQHGQHRPLGVSC